jgi:rare lipoprotein A (peptidoglycan hydrolase)
MLSKQRRNPNGLLASAWWVLLPLVAIPILDLEFRTNASWYGPGFQGRKTASGEIFDQNKLTAASRTLPFGTRLTVQNMQNGKSCEVVINDRGPYVSGRGLDLSLGAARQIDMPGVAPVLCYTHIHENSPANEDFASRRHQSPPLIASRPSRSQSRHSRVRSVRYVAYEGAQRTVFDGASSRWSKFVHTYRG